VADANLRHSVPAVVLDEKDRVLLCRFDLSTQGVVVWATPGGGIEAAESPLEALTRELDEELGLAVVDEPPHVWHQRVVAEGQAEGYDGVINDCYLIKTDNFTPTAHLELRSCAPRTSPGSDGGAWASCIPTGAMPSLGHAIWLHC